MPRTIFANRIAVFLWGFALVWLSILGLFTWILVRDGAPEGQSPHVLQAVMAVFWIAGAGLLAFALSKPCYTVSIGRDGVVCFTRQYPHKRRRYTVPADQLTFPKVHQVQDNDGSAYFETRIDLPDATTFILAECHDRARCETARARFVAAIRARTP